MGQYRRFCIAACRLAQFHGRVMRHERKALTHPVCGRPVAEPQVTKLKKARRNGAPHDLDRQTDARVYPT